MDEKMINKKILVVVLVAAFAMALVYAAPIFNSAERLNKDMEFRTDQKGELEDRGYGSYSYNDHIGDDSGVRYLKSTNGLPMPHSPKIKTYYDECVLWNETYALDNQTVGYNILTDYEDRLRDVVYSSVDCIQEDRFNYTDDEMIAKFNKWESSVLGDYADVSISRGNVEVDNVSRTGNVSVTGRG